MAKKPQPQTETSSHTLSREDRKTQQICRMIEREEKLRLKREEKKKLAVLNKAAGNKVGVNRKSKKMDVLSQQRPQVVISIQFADKVKTQSAANRYFFERKQTIEERQRQREDERWARYVYQQNLKVQANLLQVAASGQSAPRPSYQPNSYHVPTNNYLLPQVPGLDPTQTSMSQVYQINGFMAQGQASGAQVGPQQFYLNAGETGGNFDHGLEDHSGSSYLSSASKQLTHARQLAASQPASRQQLNQLPLPLSALAQAEGRVSPTPDSPQLHPLAVPVAPQQSLGSVINGLQRHKSTLTVDSAAEEIKDRGGGEAAGSSGQGAARAPPSVQIKVKLAVSEAQKAGNPAIASKANSAKQEVASQVRNKLKTAAPPKQDSVMTEEQKVLQLTRQTMLQRRS